MRLTVDDSLEEVVGGSGKELLQFIRMGDGLIPHVSSIPKELKKVTITSDGAHYISSILLDDILANTNVQNDVVEQLITVANWRGGRDNASVASILLDELAEQLKLSEPGIEVWDSFGSLHVMWTKNEHEEPALIPNIYDDVHENTKKQTELPSKKIIQKKAKNASKKNITKKINLNKNIEQKNKQIEIEIKIEPINTPSRQDVVKNDDT
jgi:hypothetical protein